MYCKKANLKHKEIKNLYLKAFPENERIPFNQIENMPISIWAFEEKDFLGFAMTLSHETLTHILFFAIKEEKRNQGIGSQCLKEIKKLYPKQSILVDIEKPNTKLRIRRKNFYLRNQFKESSIHYSWENEDYDILVYGPSITEKDFWEFWDFFIKD